MMGVFKTPTMEAFPMFRWFAPVLLLVALSAPAFAQWNEDAQDCYEDTKPESFNADKALPACERAMRSGELTPRNLAQMYYYRGTIWMNKKDYKRAIEDFTEAAQRDPTLPQAHQTLGFARFFVGDFQPAARNFADSLDLRRDDVYAMLWIYIVRSRDGENDAKNILRQVSREVNISEWPGTLVAYYLGNMNQEALLKAANDSDPKRRREKQCEATFYIGQQLLIEGKKAEAAKMFKAALAPNVTKFVEYEGARVELQRMASAK